MRYLTIFLFFIFISVSGYSQVKVVKFPELERYISDAGDKIKVINFWATWCGPCIKELPFFDALQDNYSPEDLEVMLVSLDFEDQKERVNKFLERKSISSAVWLLDETDANSFIDKVDPRWSGAIPATLLINSKTGQRIFLEKELSKEELEQHIDKLLK